MTSKINLYGTLAFLWLSHLIVDVMIGIWPIYKTMAHMDLALAGLIAGVCAFIGEGMQVFFGALSDKGYRKSLICVGVVVASSSLLFPHVEGPVFLFLLYLLTCFGSGAFHPAAVSHMGMLTVRRKSLYIAIFASGGALGLASSQLIFSYFYQRLDGSTAYLLLPLALIVLLIALYPFAQGPALLKTEKKPISWDGVKLFFASKDLINLYFCQVCISSIFWGIIFLLPDLLISRGYEDWICLGGGHFCFIFGGALMMIPSGYLADRYSAKSVLVGAVITGSLLFYTFYFIPLLPPLFTLILLFLMGAALGIVNPISVAQGHRLMPSHPGLISAIMMGLAFCVSESIGPGGGGFLSEFFTEDAAAKALAIIGLLSIPALRNALSLSSGKETASGPSIEYAA